MAHGRAQEIAPVMGSMALGCIIDVDKVCAEAGMPKLAKTAISIDEKTFAIITFVLFAISFVLFADSRRTGTQNLAIYVWQVPKVSQIPSTITHLTAVSARTSDLGEPILCGNKFSS